MKREVVVVLVSRIVPGPWHSDDAEQKIPSCYSTLLGSWRLSGGSITTLPDGRCCPSRGDELKLFKQVSAAPRLSCLDGVHANHRHTTRRAGAKPR